ncbi:MAG TPA: hypothetical protein VFW07_19160 [Parafilimonas sp.]|nr:hypothetical protein [Parafilimonas sp.]
MIYFPIQKTASKLKQPFRQAVTIFLLCVSGALAAQTLPVKKWDRRYGGNSIDLLQYASLQQTSDNGYIMGGYTGSDVSGDKTQPGWGEYDYWVVKTDSNGVKAWDKRFGGIYNDIMTCLLQTSDGRYLFGGYTASSETGDVSEATRGGLDYWIVKTYANGEKQWDKRYGGSSSDVMNTLVQTFDGGYILGGYSASGADGDKSRGNQGSNDFWVVKIDTAGVKEWDSTFGGTGDDQLFGIWQTADSGYILGGHTTSAKSGDVTQDSRGGVDYWIVKITKKGTKQWDARFGGTANDVFTVIQQTRDNGYILGGYSSSPISGDKTQPNWDVNNISNDYWIVKTDSLGVKEWDRRFGNNAEDFLYTIQQKLLGFILGGYSDSNIGGDKTVDNQGGGDYWLVKVNNDGSKEWDLRYGGSSLDYLMAIGTVREGGYILGGHSLSGQGGDKSQGGRGLQDYWIVRLGYPVTNNEDRDGLDDYGEFIHETDPFNFDTNGDGLADGVNVFLGLNPLSTDTDGDGIPNTQETQNGTIPLFKDTDGDGVADNQDPFPLDRYRAKLTPKKPSDHKAPVITLQEPF